MFRILLRRPATPGRRGLARRLLPFALALAVLVATAGVLTGFFLRVELPDVRALEDYDPPQMTRVLAADGVEIDSFAEERRIVIDLDGIPLRFRQALLAVEDAGFERHAGIDAKGLVRAVWRNVTSLSAAEGGSTITQQLARNLFLTPRKTMRRKAQEAFLALQIEQQYTKDEILRFYCNQIYMGHGRYGLEAASRFYYDRPARALTLSQAATLAGLIQRPEAYSPLRDPERARERRDVVLRRMVDVGVLSPDEAAAARAEPVAAAPRASGEHPARYFGEEVRRWLAQRHGTTRLNREGLEVGTTLDRDLQELANRAVDRGLRELDRRQGWRGVAGRVPAGAAPSTWEDPAWQRGLEIGAVHRGVVEAVERGSARVRVGRYRGSLGPEEIAWTGRTDPAKLLRPGDLVEVRLIGATSDDMAQLALEQEPRVEGALVALDPTTGAVRALVGGFSYARSEFDRAIQARRQTGSAFKPFVYAAALAAGFTLADPLVDEPTIFLDPQLPEPYQPQNYGKTYHGRLTLRTALEQSTNAATVRLMVRVGPDRVIDIARRLGITTPLEPYPSLALGAFEISLLELTAAYGAFANGGVLVQPHLIGEVRDAAGAVVERIDPVVSDALSPQVAYLVNRALEGVVTDGTGRAAAGLDLPVAGKTGTTDDYADAWFVGYSPRLVVGVWVGFDQRRSLGSRETGAHAALPIWLEFMEGARSAVGAEDFPEPPGIVGARIDRRTGRLGSPASGCEPLLNEVFLEGTEPAAACTAAAHVQLQMPGPLQEYPLDEQGALVIPVADLDALGELLPAATFDAARGELSVPGPDGPLSLPFRVADAPASEGPAGLNGPPASWYRTAEGQLVRAITLR